MSMLFPLFVIEEFDQKRKSQPAPQTSQHEIDAELLKADLLLINSSGGKDSQAALEEVVLTTNRLQIPRSRLVVAHADLGNAEWPGARELAEEQARHYDLAFEVTRYRSENGEHRSLLEHVLRRGR